MKGTEAFKGKVIQKIELTPDNERLVIAMGEDFIMTFADHGQDCCEHRYMHTDDDLIYFVGATFLNAEILDGPEMESECGETKESQFLVIRTSKGAFTIANYNEHNGYYGGFDIDVTTVTP